MDPNCIRTPLIFEFLVVSYDLDSNSCQSIWLKNISGLYLEEYLGIPLLTVASEIKLVLLFTLVYCSFFLYRVDRAFLKSKFYIIGRASNALHVSKTMLQKIKIIFFLFQSCLQIFVINSRKSF
jgi:hypothetical protein